MDKYLIYSVEDDSLFRKVIEKSMIDYPDIRLELFPDASLLLDGVICEPRILLLDYNLPDMNGMDLFLAFKNLCPETIIIIVSSERKEKILNDFKSEDVFEFVFKDDNIVSNLKDSIYRAIKLIA